MRFGELQIGRFSFKRASKFHLVIFMISRFHWIFANVIRAPKKLSCRIEKSVRFIKIGIFDSGYVGIFTKYEIRSSNISIIIASRLRDRSEYFIRRREVIIKLGEIVSRRRLGGSGTVTFFWIIRIFEDWSLMLERTRWNVEMSYE